MTAWALASAGVDGPGAAGGRGARRSLDEQLVALADEELRLLAGGVGDHLPAELAERVLRVRAERLRLLDPRGP
jgi:hypothetical protein